MHDCHVLILWVFESVILIRIIGRETPWILDRPIISKLVLLYVSHTWRVVLSLMCDYQMSHGRGTLLSPKLNFDCEQWARPRTAVPYGENAYKRKKESNRSIQIKCLKCTPNVVMGANICLGFLRVKTCTSKNISISSSWCFWFDRV